MNKRFTLGLAAMVMMMSCLSCTTRNDGGIEQITLMTLDPGHFHAALVQKTMIPGISPVAHMFAPQGPDAADHLARISGFNSRAEDPTRWEMRVYMDDDYLEQMLEQRPGNVVILSGRNRDKTRYIKASVDAGLNVLADKPMCIDAAGCELLENAFADADRNGVLLYDIMTERSEITTILQRELSRDPAVFGELLPGTVERPAVIKESVHHFFKNVAGKPIKRPGWYFDTTQQGEGIVDVTTHLVDLVMWGCFPGQRIDFDRDVRMLKARRWPTMISREQYKKVTQLDDFPAFPADKLDADGNLPCFANGEMNYTLRGVHVKIVVKWNFEAPAGAGDTHYSIMRGSKAALVIRQDADQKYRPELYVEPAAGVDHTRLGAALKKAVKRLQKNYPGVALTPHEDGWRVLIPGEYRIGHEAHFAQVMERYLQYLADGKLPAWEVPNMLAKYRTTTAALELARETVIR